MQTQTQMVTAGYAGCPFLERLVAWVCQREVVRETAEKDRDTGYVAVCWSLSHVSWAATGGAKDSLHWRSNDIAARDLPDTTTWNHHHSQHSSTAVCRARLLYRLKCPRHERHTATQIVVVLRALQTSCRSIVCPIGAVRLPLSGMHL